MITENSMSLDWIDEKSKEFEGADKFLTQKVIRAFALLEELSKSELEFIFKGGTALFLLLDEPKRFSIDIDIVIEQKMDKLNNIFDNVVNSNKFNRYVEDKRLKIKKINKEHFKFYFPTQIGKQRPDENILLDIVYEENPYGENLLTNNIESPFLHQEGDIIKVTLPSIDAILGDKLTAFAPNTVGIPYQRNNRSMSMEIVKQLYDIGSLFDLCEDIGVIKEVFDNIFQIQSGYIKERKLTITDVRKDIMDTALCIISRGVIGDGNFKELQSGIISLNPYIFSENFHLEKAMILAAKTVYLSEALNNNVKNLEKFKEPSQVTSLVIDFKKYPQINRLKKSNPEAFFYLFYALS